MKNAMMILALGLGLACTGCPDDGRDGLDGWMGEDGEDGEKGDAGAPGEGTREVYTGNTGSDGLTSIKLDITVSLDEMPIMQAWEADPELGWIPIEDIRIPIQPDLYNLRFQIHTTEPDTDYLVVIVY